MNIRKMLPFFYLFISSAHADQVLLSNGDHLSGKIVRMEAGKLTLKTSWAVPKEITLSWPAVAQIELTTPAHVVLQTEEFDGTIGPDDRGAGFRPIFFLFQPPCRRAHPARSCHRIPPSAILREQG